MYNRYRTERLVLRNKPTAYLRTIALAVLVTAAAAWTACDVRAQGFGEITVLDSNRCLDADVAQPNNQRNPVFLADCSGGQSQKWHVNSDGTIVNAQSHQCLTGSPGSVANDNCTSTQYQKWHWLGFGSISWENRNVQINECLDHFESSVVLQACSNEQNQAKNQVWQVPFMLSTDQVSIAPGETNLGIVGEASTVVSRDSI